MVVTCHALKCGIFAIRGLWRSHLIGGARGYFLLRQVRRRARALCRLGI